MKLMLKYIDMKLPQSLVVQVKKEGSEYHIAVPELNTFTYAEKREDIDSMVNDLIYCYFDVPKKDQREIRFIPKSPRSKKEYLIQATPAAYRRYG